ncbi:hypothetical protein LINPERPRIM_LOCUS8233 [Linum perenne]
MSSGNPKKWRFTWEAQSHAANLKLIIFNPDSRPSSDCSNLSVHLKLSQCHVLLSWTEEEAAGVKNVSLKVPIPNVLIDTEVPVTSRALDDHIEVKVVLLLPVDHPILSSFDSALDSVPLEMSSDLKSLSSSEEGVNLYCRMCSAQLTKSSIRNFEVMPSENWREVADNWFGGCCCSFGGVGEELVNTFADAYECGKGLCLLSSAAVTLCKDDIIGCEFSDSEPVALDTEPVALDTGCLSEEKDEHQNGRVRPSEINSIDGNKMLKCEDLEGKNQLSGGTTAEHGCCDSECHGSDYEPSSVHDEAMRATKFPEHQKSFLNGFLGDAFMVGSYNRSVDIGWMEFLCPQCSILLGAYPVTSGNTPVDNGIRLFKCSISTDLPASGPGDIFRRYTLEKMFTNKLAENAKDELSYRTLVKDLVTKAPMLQVVLLNPNSWSSTGICLDAQNAAKSISKLNLRPVIKVLFSSCWKGTEWGVKHTADEAFVVKPLIEELISALKTSKHDLPASFVQVENMSLSTLLR